MDSRYSGDAELQRQILVLQAQISTFAEQRAHWRRCADQDYGTIARLNHQISSSQVERELLALQGFEELTRIQKIPFRFQHWVITRIGKWAMRRKERARRLLEEAIEIAQAEGITMDDIGQQVLHIYSRPVGDPLQEAGGVGACLAGYCMAIGVDPIEATLAELDRIEAKDPLEILGSLARKQAAGLMESEL